VDDRSASLEVPGFGRVAVPADKAPGVTEGPAKLVLRAEKLRLVPTGNESDGNAAEAVVETVDYQGQTVRYFVRIGGRQFQAINMIDDRPFDEGTTVTAVFRGRDCAALPGG
jgi:putative spermidine/putrescine transport system ATP-binding protein/spermidine/putrescine transport system ATP-binding protein